MQSFGRRLQPVVFAVASLVLFGSGIWANMNHRPLQEMRGAWLTQSMRGMAY